MARKKSRKKVIFPISLSENTPLQARIISSENTNDHLGLVNFIQLKGALPLNIDTSSAKYRQSYNLVVRTQLFDETDDNEVFPLLSIHEDLRDESTKIFKCEVNIGKCSSGDGFGEWTTVGIIPTTHVVTPFSGERTIQALISLIQINGSDSEFTADLLNSPSPDFIFSTQIDFILETSAVGYTDEKYAEWLAIYLESAIGEIEQEAELDEQLELGDE